MRSLDENKIWNPANLPKAKSYAKGQPKQAAQKKPLVVLNTFCEHA